TGDLRRHAPGPLQLAHVALEQAARECPRPLERVLDGLRAGVRVAVEVAADPRAERERRHARADELPQLGDQERRDLPEALLEEPEAPADLVGDERTLRAHLVALPEHRDLLRERGPQARRPRSRELRVVELAQDAGDPP